MGHPLNPAQIAKLAILRKMASKGMMAPAARPATPVMPMAAPSMGGGVAPMPNPMFSALRAKLGGM